MRRLIVTLCFAWCAAFYTGGQQGAAQAGGGMMSIALNDDDDGPQCSSATDAKFAIGQCEQAYYECMNGVRLVKTCSDNEVFDATTQRCVLYADAVDCVIADTLEQSQNDVDIIDAQQQLRPNCTFLPDGDYPAGYCQIDYYQCLEGERVFRLCPLGYVFEFESRQCIPFVKVGYCTAHKFGEGRLVPSCNYMVDGSHEIGQCRQAYLVCSGGQGHLQYCPTSYVFNSVVQRCIKMETLLECLMSTPETPETPTTRRFTSRAVTYPVKIKSTALPYVSDISAPPNAAVYSPLSMTSRSAGATVNTASVMDLILSTSSSSALPTHSVTVIPGVTANEQFNCAFLRDGYYAEPNSVCSALYYMCQRGIATKYECLGGLIFDAKKIACVQKQEIVGCGGKGETVVSTVTETDTTSSVSAASASTDAVIGVSFDCNGLQDGFYINPRINCSDSYFVCTSGMASELTCQMGLTYNPTTMVCDYYENIYSCGLVMEVKNSICEKRESGYFVFQSTVCKGVYYSCLQGTMRVHKCAPDQVFVMEERKCAPRMTVTSCTHNASVTTTAQAAAIDCSNRTDGVYADPFHPCTHSYYACFHQIGGRLHCPANLYFNAETQACTARQETPGCGAVSTITVISPPAATTNTATTNVVVQDAGITAVFDCSKRSNGLYADPSLNCSDSFYACSNGMATLQKCPPGLYFNPEIQDCQRFADIFVCTGTTKSTMSVTLKSSPTIIVTTSRPQFDCAEKADGLYANPAAKCSTFYYQCSNGYAYKFMCGFGLHYDPVRRECNHFQNIYACTGRTVSVPLSTTTTVGVSTVAVTFDCSMLRDGNYADPDRNCSSWFYSCSNGIVARRQCPVRTYFDAEYGTCDLFENVPVCSGRTRTTTIAQNVTMLSSTGAVQTVPQLSCANLADGYYSVRSCSTQFYACISGQLYMRACPKPLYYDATFNRCDYKRYVEQCNGTRRSTPATSVTTGTTVLTSLGQVSDEPFDCTTLADGSYADPDVPCSPRYFSCYNGQSAVLYCPPGLCFDPLRKECQSRHQLEGCGGRKQSAVYNEKLSS